MRSVTTVAFMLGLVLAVQAFADDVVTQERDVDGFSGIAFSLPGDLHIEQSGNESLRVAAGADVIDDIITEVEDGVLVIRREDSLWSSRMGKVEVWVEIDDFESLAISGSGDADAGTIEADDFALRISGSGSVAFEALTCDEVDVAVTGSAEVTIAELTANRASTKIGGSGEVTWGGVVDAQAVTISGSGDYHAADLESNEAEVVVSGSGDVDIRVEDELDAVVSGSGSIRYHGDPEVSKVIAGSGDVSRR